MMLRHATHSGFFARLRSAFWSTDDSNDKQSSTRTSSVPKDADRYNMNHENRGKCIIFNNDKFSNRTFSNPEGSEKDLMRLKKSFNKLGFDVEIEDNLGRREIMDKIKKLREYNHTDNDCFCIIVLTHGQRPKNYIDDDDILWSKDEPYSFEDIWKPFIADNCTTLAGKPKLFFFLACRGSKVEAVRFNKHQLSYTYATPEMGKARIISSYAIPTHADILIVHDLAQNSYIGAEKGICYVQCLCEILNEHGTEMDLTKLLTLTALKVVDFPSNNPTNRTMYDMKEMLSMTSMLIRSVYFSPKSNEQATTA